MFTVGVRRRAPSFHRAHGIKEVVMLRRSLLATLVTLPLVAACASGKSSGSKSPASKSSAGARNIPGMLTELRRFKELLKAAQAAGFTQTLSGGGPYTLFAPTDSAFDAMEDRELQKLMQDKGRLARVWNIIWSPDASPTGTSSR